MSGYLESISGKIPHTHHKVNIQLDGKNLILTGGNGCGKTSFLNQLYEKIDASLNKDRENAHQQGIKELISQYTDHLLTTNGSAKADLQNKIKLLETQLENENKERILPKISNYDEYFTRYSHQKSILRHFTAQRQIKIEVPIGLKFAGSAIGDFSDKHFGPKLEQYLVNLKGIQSFALTEKDDQTKAKQIEHWFSQFKKDLQFLMEDSTTELIFRSNQFTFTIQQQGKEPFTFQNLSSGYSAIFAIFADLTMRSVYYEVTPNELTGIVLIDEIDVHLHVSLQRKILPFLVRSFPKLQFIVTTHSPFVITSVSDTVIYDLSKREQISDDLTMYSYEAVVEGLLGVPPVSEKLTKELNELVGLIEGGAENKDKIEKIVNKLRPVNEHLSDEAKLTYHEAAYFLIKQKNLEMAEKN